MTILQQGRDTDFFENYNHSGKRVVAKALSDTGGPSSIWSWRTTPMWSSLVVSTQENIQRFANWLHQVMCDTCSQIAVAIEVRQSGAGGRTVLGVWPTCWYFPHSRHTRAVVGLLRWRSSEELLTWSYVVGSAEYQSSWHSRCTQWSMWSCQDKRLLIWTPKCLWVVTRGMYEPCMKTSHWLRFWVFVVQKTVSSSVFVGKKWESFITQLCTDGAQSKVKDSCPCVGPGQQWTGRWSRGCICSLHVGGAAVRVTTNHEIVMVTQMAAKSIALASFRSPARDVFICSNLDGWTIEACWSFRKPGCF